MRGLREYDQSLPLPIQVADDHVFAMLLKKELKLRTISTSELTFSSNGYCGLFNLGGVSHFIVPRFGEKMLEVLLPLVFGINRKTFFSVGGLSHDGLAFADGIASLFLSAYRELQQESLRFDYSVKHVKGLLSSGALAVDKSLTFLESGAGVPCWKKTVFEIDTPLNQSIKFIFKALISTFPLGRGMKLSVDQVLNELERVSIARNPDYLHLISTLNRTNDHYKGFLELAAALQLGMNQSDGQVTSVCCLFESWRIFQQAVKNAMSVTAQSLGLRANSKSSLSLEYTIGSKRLDPDLIVYSDEPRILAIGDIKYVENDGLDLERSNMFQVNAYMDGYNFERSFLVYPSKLAFGWKEYPLRWGKKVSVYRVPVTSTEDFLNGVKELLGRELYGVKAA